MLQGLLLSGRCAEAATRLQGGCAEAARCCRRAALQLSAAAGAGPLGRSWSRRWSCPETLSAARRLRLTAGLLKACSCCCRAAGGLRLPTGATAGWQLLLSRCCRAAAAGTGRWGSAAALGVAGAGAALLEASTAVWRSWRLAATATPLLERCGYCRRIADADARCCCRTLLADCAGLCRTAAEAARC